MQAWDHFLKEQENELGADLVDKWLRPFKVAFEAPTLQLEAVDAFQAKWFEEQMLAKADAWFKRNNKKRIRIRLTVANGSPSKKRGKFRTDVPIEPTMTIAHEGLDPLCTFENYIITKENILTHKLLGNVCGCDPETGKIIPKAKLELTAVNPIYLYGITGSGKTHLLQASAHALRQHGVNAIYARAETFTDHVVKAIRAGEMSLFRQAYRNIDVLLLDDVHIFSRKAATQEELFHTFNTLHVSGKLIILAANCAPGDLQHIEPRLVSRFEWGIVLPLEMQSKEEFAKILQKKAAALNFELHPKIVDFLQNTFTSNSKSLIRALEALILRTHHAPGPLTLQTAKNCLADLIKEEEKFAVNEMKILASVAEHYGIRSEDLLGHNQNRDCVLQRQIAMHLCRSQLNMPFMKIGDLFGKDHSTVMSSVKRIQEALDGDDPEVSYAWHSIFKKLREERQEVPA